MGLILKPNEVKSAVSQIKNDLGDTKEVYANSFRGIVEFAYDEELQAESWNTTKQDYEEAHRAIVQGMSAAQSSIELDLRTLEGIVGNEDLIEDELILQIQRLLQECEMYETKIYTLEMMKETFLMLDSGSISVLIARYRGLLQNTKEILYIMKEKLQILYEKESATSSLFSFVLTLIQAVEYAINDAGVYINGIGTLSDGSWKTTIPTMIKDVQTEITEKILNDKFGISSQEFINEYGNKALDDVKEYMVNNYFAKGLVVDTKNVEIRIKCEMLEDVYEEQFGFDDRTTDILSDVYMKTYAKYGEETDWYFARSLSQMGGYDSYKVWNKVETNVWFKGAGKVYEHEESEIFFCGNLGINKEDYDYLYYTVRLQHFISSSPYEYNYDAVYNLAKEEAKREQYMSWMRNMAKAYGDKTGDLTERENFESYSSIYLERYNELDEQFGNKGDFSHMLYTISANIKDEGEKIDNYFTIAKSTGLYWESVDERKDVVGWLGDAVYIGDNKKVSFENTDYIADLDADNIAYRMQESRSNLVDAMLQYYCALDLAESVDAELSKEEIEHKNRTREFLEHNNYEDIEHAIFDRIDVEVPNQDSKMTYKDLEGNTTYEGTYDFLKKLRG